MASIGYLPRRFTASVNIQNYPPPLRWIIVIYSEHVKGTASRLCARASVICFFSSKDNKFVILTRQDFLPDRTADGDLLFIFSSNILDFQRNLSSYLKFGSRHEDSSRFFCSQGCLATRKSRCGRFKNSFSNEKLMSEVNCSTSSNICLISSRSSPGILASNVWRT